MRIRANNALRVLIGTAMVALSLAVVAQPAVIKVVVPFPAGGISDQAARILAAEMAREMGQPFIVENRPGAGGRLGIDAVAKAPADGRTLLFTNTSYSILPIIDAKAQFDPGKSLAPVSMAATYGLLIVASKQIPATTLPEFIAYAKRNPGKLNYGSAGMGSGSHFAGEYFKALAGTFLVHIPYRSTSSALTDVAGGQLDLTFDAAAKPLIDAGNVTLLAVTSDKRDPRFPGTPTAAEAGLKSFVLTSWLGLLAPTGTPESVVESLNRAATKAVANTSVQQRFSELGLQPQGGAASRLRTAIGADTSLYRKIANDAKLKFE